MADGLKLSQLATLLAMSAQQPAAYDPASAAFINGLIGSGQSATMAEAEKKARKDAKKKQGKGIGAMVGTAGALAAAPFTGGASLSFLPMAASAGGAIDSAIAGDTSGAVTNAADAGMGYMMSKSLPGASTSAKKPADQSTPDPMFAPAGAVQSKPLAAPAGMMPAGTTAPADKTSNAKTSMLSPALMGITAAGLTRGMANRRAAKAGGPPRPGQGDPNFRTAMAPNAATMTPAEIRKAPAVTKLAMTPSNDGSFGSNTLTKAQARALGWSPEQIASAIKRGLIVDDGSTGDVMKSGLAAGLLPLLIGA